jgi:hypothetical protein
MGVVMIRCPETGRGIQTQYTVPRERFRTTPVFFSRSYCPICRNEHEWFARDAWVDEQLVKPQGSHPGTAKEQSDNNPTRGRRVPRLLAKLHRRPSCGPAPEGKGNRARGVHAPCDLANVITWPTWSDPLRPQNIAGSLMHQRTKPKKQTHLKLLTEEIAHG